MLSDAEKRSLAARLCRAEGQVAGVGRMVTGGGDCGDVLLQIAAVRAALARVGRLVLENLVNSCVERAMTDGNDAAREQKLRELLDLFERFADLKGK